MTITGGWSRPVTRNKKLNMPNSTITTTSFALSLWKNSFYLSTNNIITVEWVKIIATATKAKFESRLTCIMAHMPAEPQMI